MTLSTPLTLAARNTNGGIPIPGWAFVVLFVLALAVIGWNLTRRK